VQIPEAISPKRGVKERGGFAPSYEILPLSCQNGASNIPEQIWQERGTKGVRLIELRTCYRHIKHPRLKAIAVYVIIKSEPL